MTTRRIGKTPLLLRPTLRSLDRSQYLRIQLSKSLFTEPVTKELQNHYPKLKVERSESNLVLNTSRLKGKELSDLVTDIDFYRENPSVAIENIVLQ